MTKPTRVEEQSVRNERQRDLLRDISKHVQLSDDYSYEMSTIASVLYFSLREAFDADSSLDPPAMAVDEDEQQFFLTWVADNGVVVFGEVEGVYSEVEVEAAEQRFELSAIRMFLCRRKWIGTRLYMVTDDVDVNLLEINHRGVAIANFVRAGTGRSN
jgi:hypothetical protein